jgi:tetratricopeptide (TPR) repeat protein
MIKARKREIVRSKKLSDFLHHVRTNSSLTLMDVQEKSKRYREKVNLDYLSRVERGTLFPSLPKLLTLARVYKLSPAIFFDLIEIEEYQKVKPDLDDFEECNAYGINCANHGELDKAIGAFSKCVDLISKDKRLKDKESYFSKIHLHSAIAFRQKGKLSLAREELEKALLNREIKPYLKMRILNEFANLYIHQNNISLAEIFIDQALALAKNEKDDSIISASYITKANGLIREGSYKEAASFYTKAIKLLEKKNDKPNLVTAVNNLGSCLIKMGRPEKSIGILQKARLLSEKEGLKRIYTNVLVNLGDAYRVQKMFDKAKLYLLEASRISREYDYAKSAFLSNFYLWKIAVEKKDRHSEKEYFASLKFYRTKVQEMFDDLKEFDAILKMARSKRSFRGKHLQLFER